MNNKKGLTLMFTDPPRVPPQRVPNAKICLVGQSPGEQEVKHNRPFYEKAPAGSLLTQCLSFAYIPRSACHITNVFKERPPNGNIKKWLSITERGNVHESTKFKEEKEFLRQELTEIQPNCTVALGVEALYTLTGLTNIGKWRGSILESNLVPGLKVIPSYHPAGCLISRNYIGRYPLVNDLRKAKKQGEFPGVHLTPRVLETAKRVSTIVDFLKIVKELRTPFAFDIEILNRQVSCLSIATHPGYSLCIPFVYEHNESYWPLTEEMVVWRYLSDILSDPLIPKMGQNLLFDITFLAWMNDIITQGPIYDTMVAHALLYPDLPKGLDFLTSCYTDVPYYKDEGKFWKAPGQTKDWELGWEYNAKDSVVIPEIWEKLKDQLHTKGMWPTYERVIKTFPALTFMMIKGLRVNTEKKEKYSLDLETQYVKLRQDLNNICGFELNPHSPKQIATYFYVMKKIKPYTKRGTGSMTTDDTTLLRIERKGFKEAGIIRDLRRINKIKSTYLDISLDDDNRLRSSINPVGASTGRLSTSKNIFGNGMNTQNQPPASRVFLESDPQHILAAWDLMQAEIWPVAFVSREPKLMKVLRNPNKKKGDPESDIHALTAKLFSDRGLDIPRPVAKEVNLASNYGMGSGTMSLLLTDAGFPTTQKEAATLSEMYHTIYPNIRSVYHRSVEGELAKSATVINLLGRKRYFQRPRNDDLLRQAYDYKAQSTVADVMNTGMVKVYNIWGFAVDLLAQIHDELLGQVPLVEPHDLATILWGVKKCLEMELEVYGESFTIPSEIKIGFNWRDMEELDVSSFDRLVDGVHRVYREHGITEPVSCMGWSRSTLSGATAESIS